MDRPRALRRPLLVGLLAVTLITTTMTEPVGAHGTASELDAVDGRIDGLSTELSNAERTHTELAGSLAATEARMSQLRSQLDTATHDVEAAEAELAVLMEQQSRLNDSIDQLVASIAQTATERVNTLARLEVQAVELYMSAAGGDALLPLMFPSAEAGAVAVTYLGDAADQSDLLVRDLESLGDQGLRDLDALDKQQSALDKTAEEVLLRRDDLADRRSDVATVTAEVAAERSSQLALLGEIDRAIETFESELAGLELEQDRLQELLRLEQEDGGSPPGRLLWPVQGRISSVFGYRTHPVTGVRKLHSGLDIAAPSGTPLSAAAGGRVVLADWFGGYGLTVIIDHGGGVATLYAHQSRLSVSTGDTVSSGNTIGYVGSTGLSTGPHVHFEVRTDGSSEDPLPWLRG